MSDQVGRGARYDGEAPGIFRMFFLIPPSPDVSNYSAAAANAQMAKKRGRTARGGKGKVARASPSSSGLGLLVVQAAGAGDVVAGFYIPSGLNHGRPMFTNMQNRPSPEHVDVFLYYPDGLRPIPPPCLRCGADACWMFAAISRDASRELQKQF